MQHNNGEANQQIQTTSYLADDLTSASSDASNVELSPGQRAADVYLASFEAEEERISLSLLRRRIRAGWYQDDLHSQEANHLLFLRWLVRAGLMSEWNEEEDEGTVLAR